MFKLIKENKLNIFNIFCIVLNVFICASAIWHDRVNAFTLASAFMAGLLFNGLIYEYLINTYKTANKSLVESNKALIAHSKNMSDEFFRSKDHLDRLYKKEKA